MPTETDFVPSDIDCRDWSQIEPLVNDLLDREFDSAESLERWLVERSDLESYIYETKSRLHVRMTCHTDAEEAQAAYRAFNENIQPKYSEASFKLNQKYYECPHRDELDPRRYGVFDKGVAADIEIFRDENVPIETELSALGQEHRKITGAQTVEFEGEERTFPAMAKFFESPERERRERAWRAIEDRRMKDREALRGIFDQMIERRHRIARNADFDNFRDYSFVEKHRFDYSVAECEAFHEAVERHVVPVSRSISEVRRKALQVQSYRPWDTAVDVKGRDPLDPFDSDVDQMIEGTQKVFQAMDHGLGDLFDRLKGPDSLDLDTRVGKAPGGYQTVFAVERRPFIFMNASGVGRDMRTLLHEAGHAFHTLLGGNDPLINYRHAPIEFCEVASMTMELTALPWLDQVYTSDEEADRARRVQLEGIVRILPWIAQIDAFQHWLYTNPEHGHDEREEMWLDLEERFGSGVDWSGLEEYRRESWQRQLHLYHYPFYYIEYGIAQIGALQIWLNYRQDPEAAIAQYKAGLALGGSRPLPELFQTAGATFDFGSSTISEVVTEVQQELEKLPV